MGRQCRQLQRVEAEMVHGLEGCVWLQPSAEAQALPRWQLEVLLDAAVAAGPGDGTLAMRLERAYALLRDSPDGVRADCALLAGYLTSRLAGEAVLPG